MALRRTMRSIGRGQPWTPDVERKRRRIPTAASPLPMRNNPVLDPEVEEPAAASRSARLFLVAAAAIPCRWSFRRTTGCMEFLSARPWLRKRPRRRRARLARCGAIRWQCCLSAVTTSAIISEHWLEIGQRLTSPPLIFNVNWFRKGANGKFLCPGFGQNLRVLKWIIERCEGQGGANASPNRRQSRVRKIWTWRNWKRLRPR